MASAHSAEAPAPLYVAEVAVLAGLRLEERAVVLVAVHLPRRAVAPAVALHLAAHRARGDTKPAGDLRERVSRVEPDFQPPPLASVEMLESPLLSHGYHLPSRREGLPGRLTLGAASSTCSLRVGRFGRAKWLPTTARSHGVSGTKSLAIVLWQASCPVLRQAFACCSLAWMVSWAGCGVRHVCEQAIFCCFNV